MRATLDAFDADGFRGLSIDDVARRSGVAKTTIYRWWPSKLALLLEAISVVRQQPAVADTGSVRTDLIAHVEAFIELHRDPRVVRLLADLLAEAMCSPAMSEVRPTFVAAQRAPLRRALDRAVDRGELPGGIDHELTMDLLLSPVVNRALATGGALDPGLAASIVDVVLAGVRAGAASGRRDRG